MYLQFTLEKDLLRSTKQCAPKTGVCFQSDDSYSVLQNSFASDNLQFAGKVMGKRSPTTCFLLLVRVIKRIEISSN